MKEFKKTKEGLFICEECGKIITSKRKLSYHINIKHEGTEIYYNKWLKEDSEGMCKICGKKTEFTGFAHFYKQCCTYECSRKLAANNTKFTKEKRYGDKKYNNHLKNLTTCKEKYNDEHYNNRKKYKETCKLRYGVDNPSQNDIVKKKKEITCFKNYGVTNIFKNREFISKILLDKYGVKNPSQIPNVHIKQQKQGFIAKKYLNTNIYYRGSYELDFLEKFYKLYPDICNGPSISYTYKNDHHYYFSDFFIPSLNLIIEIKSSWILKKQNKQIIEEKEKATIANGFNYIMILDKNYNYFPKT